MLSNDTDADNDALIVQSLTSPQHGGVALCPTGPFTYTPNTGFVGTDTFTYAVTDGVMNGSATVAISVLNEAPMAVDDAYSVRANQVLNITRPGCLPTTPTPTAIR